MIKGVYNAGYSIWNVFIDIAMTLFTTSPTTANGSIYATTHALYNSISDISIPIATVFFLIAIFRDVIMTPPDQQVRRFFGDAVKYGLMVGILANLWTLMGTVIEIADGITSRLGSASAYTLSMSAELQTVIDEAGTKPSGLALGEWADYFMTNGLFLIVSVATFLIIVASSISIVSSAFQRLIKPLAILPFASIAVAIGAGSGESTRVMTNYLKTFFGFCISGAFMVICVKLGVALSNGLVAFNVSSLTMHEKVLYISVQNAITPIVIAGLIKSADSVIGRFF